MWTQFDGLHLTIWKTIVMFVNLVSKCDGLETHDFCSGQKYSFFLVMTYYMIA